MPGQHYKTLRNFGKPTTLSTTGVQTNAALRCHECVGVRHFDRDCHTRLNWEVESTTMSGRRNPSERSWCSCSPSDKPPNRMKKGRKKGNKESGKWKRGVNEDSSFHLNVPDNAVVKSKLSILLEQDTPTISVEIVGMSISHHNGTIPSDWRCPGH